MVNKSGDGHVRRPVDVNFAVAKIEHAGCRAGARADVVQREVGIDKGEYLRSALFHFAEFHGRTAAFVKLVEFFYPL